MHTCAQGPMEEQRLKYGPDFYKVCEVGNALNVAAAVWAEAAPSCSLDTNTQVRCAVLSCRERRTLQSHH